MQRDSLGSDQSPFIPEGPSRFRYGQAIKRHAWLVALVVLLALGVATIITAIQDETYRAQTSLTVTRNGDTVNRPELADIATAQTVAALAETDEVSDRVITGLDLNTSIEKFEKKLKITVRPSAAVVDVTFDATSQEGAVRVLQTFNQVFIKVAQEDVTAQRSQRAEQLVNVKVVSRPKANPKPVAPRPARTLAFATALSLIIGMLLAFLRERFNDRIRDREDARRSFGAPVIGALPNGWKGPPTAIVGRRSPDGTAKGVAARAGLRRTDPDSQRQQVDEALQLLSLNVEALRNGRRGAAIVVTSTRQEEGKSTVVANLGVSLARGGLSVLCVEVDGREPSLHRFLNVEPSTVGLVQVAKGMADVDDAIVTVPVAGLTDTPIGVDARGSLRILTLGEPGASLAALLGEDEIELLIETLRNEADFVLFDASPLSLGEAHRLIRGSDVVLLVGRRGWTRRARAQAARAILERLGVRRAAVVLTDAAANETLV
jgi:capsular polysaccharide biosynthesis protein/Mrp family chromosome partitioning ATPase